MSIVLIFDCGATNLRTIAMNDKGKIVASHHLANNTQQGSESPDYHIWDFEEIWQKLTVCADNTIAQLKQQQVDLKEIIGISVTTFGVDGAPFDKNGQQLYPIISWKCPRTVPVMENLSQLLDIKALYQRNGIGQYSFNTLFKLLWLKENKPDIFQKMDKFVFISSMLTQRLTGKFTTDRTMAGTSMMTNLATGNWDEDILKLLGLSQNHFPPLRNAGEKVGELTGALADHWGLKRIPVISCGHDTQFAVFGSGAGLNQPVLSSGTWEILMARTEHAEPQFDFVPQGLTTEFDAQPNCFRGEIYRAALYYMANQLKQGLEVLQQVSHFKAESLLCVGGGSKNPLWNQIRADVLGLPIDVVDVAESTVLGAAMFTFAGIGIYATPEQAQQAMQPNRKRIYPSA